MPPARARAGRRDTRKLDRSHAVPQYGSTAGARERSAAELGRCGVTVSTRLTRARRSSPALALDPLPASKVQSHPLQIAELDTHNFVAGCLDSVPSRYFTAKSFRFRRDQASLL